MTPKQQRFVDEYLIDLNATQAAIRSGYSEKTAYAQGERLLKNAEVAAAVGVGQSQRSDRTGVTADRVLLEMARLGFSDLRQAFSPGGNLVNPSDWSDDTAAAISSVKVVSRRAPGSDDETEVEYVTEIKLWDKNSALDKLGKHLGMFREQIDVTLKGSLADRVAAAEQAYASRSS